MPAAIKRLTKNQKEARQFEAWRLLIADGLPEYQIAKVLECSVGTVSEDIKAMRQRVARELQLSPSEIFEEACIRAMSLYAEADRSFQASKQPEKVTTTRFVEKPMTDGPPQRTLVAETVERPHAAGDAAFLRIKKDVSDKLDRLRGLMVFNDDPFAGAGTSPVTINFVMPHDPNNLPPGAVIIQTPAIRGDGERADPGELPSGPVEGDDVDG